MSTLLGPWVSTENRSRSRSRSRVPAQVERMAPPARPVSPVSPVPRSSSLQPASLLSPSLSPPPPIDSELVQPHSYDPPPPIANLDREPFGNPPGYSAARIPIVPVTYQFCPLSFNSMILVPPADSPDTRPLYHISVHMNCWLPFSFITILRRGGTENGEYVGEFEIGMSTNDATVTMNGHEVPLQTMLESVQMKPQQRVDRRSRRWRWKSHPKPLIWDSHHNESFCYPSYNPPTETKELYAKLIPPPPSTPTPDPTIPNHRSVTELTVYPSGQRHLDAIVMSALLVERQRLTLKPAVHADVARINMFNFPKGLDTSSPYPPWNSE